MSDGSSDVIPPAEAALRVALEALDRPERLRSAVTEIGACPQVLAVDVDGDAAAVLTVRSTGRATGADTKAYVELAAFERVAGRWSEVIANGDPWGPWAAVVAERGSGFLRTTGVTANAGAQRSTAIIAGTTGGDVDAVVVRSDGRSRRLRRGQTAGAFVVAVAGPGGAWPRFTLDALRRDGRTIQSIAVEPGDR